MRVVIADGNNLMRIGLRTILSSISDLEVVGESKSNEELLDFLKSFPVDVVLIDYTSDNFDITVVSKITTKFPELKILAITPDQTAQTLVNALRSGVQSYVKKDCDVGEILDAVRETYEGNKFFCGQILETIQRASIDVNEMDFDGFTCEPISLSDREIQIIKLIASGLTNTQIAEELFLSNHTINTHRKNILAKLGVKNTAGIVIYAVKTNLVSPNKFLSAGE